MTPSSDRVSVSIPELALELHRTNESRLSIAIPEGASIDLSGHPGVTIQNGIVHFATLAELNTVLATHTVQKLRAKGPVEAESLFGAVRKLWRHEIGHKDMAAGRVLATFNSEIDVTALAADRISKGDDVFDVLHQVQALLLHAEAIPLDSLIALNDAQHEPTKGDMAAGMFFNSLENWLSTRPEVARELVAKLIAGPLRDRANILMSALMGWFNADPEAAAREVLIGAQRSGELPPLAIWLAGRMLAAETLGAALKQKFEELINQGLAGQDGPERRAAAQAAAGLLHKTTVFDAALEALADQRDQDSLASLTLALSMHDKELLEQDRYFFWLDKCLELDEKHVDFLQRLQFSLSRLVVPSGPHLQPALDFFKAWVNKMPTAGPNNRRFAELFNQCTSQILSNPRLLSTWLTDWLSSDGTKLPSSVAGVLFGVHESHLRFDTALLDAMNDDELFFLVRRLLGYIHDADQLLSLALSLLEMKHAEKRVYPTIQSLLVAEIGYDFPGSTIEALKDAAKIAEKVELKALLDLAREALEADIARLDKLPRLNELKPPSALSRQFLVARRKQQFAITKEAEKHSIFRQLVTTTYIKAGTTSFQYLREEYTEPMKMKSISHSYQVPRRESLDPVGNAIRGFQFRTAKRGQK